MLLCVPFPSHGVVCSYEFVCFSTRPSGLIVNLCSICPCCALAIRAGIGCSLW